jgi:WD40 repeat protein
MNKFLVVLLSIIPTLIFAQEEFLSRNVNHTSKNNITPSISGDGKSMIYLTDYSNTGELVLETTLYKAGKWQDPKEVSALDPTRLNNTGGYFLDNTGEAIWFSSRKPDGLGGYDIWFTKKGHSSWGRARNPGKPLNTNMDEGDPSISPDKQLVYFMRCSRISTDIAKGCQLFVSEKNKGRGLPWKEAVKLPAHINVGNTLSPRILSDNKTLVFSSDRPGGKGGLDLWMTTKEGDEWSEPINIDFVNTTDDDRYMSMSLRTDFTYITRTNSSGFKGIVKAKVPEKFRPKDVVMMMGKVIDDLGVPQSIDIRINNQTKSRLEARVKSDKETGEFVAVLTEGSKFELTFEDRSGKMAFQTQIINVEELLSSRRQYPKIELTTVRSGAEFYLGGVEFDTLSNTITASSNFEVLRIARLLKQHKDLKFNIDFYQQNYHEDSVQYSWLTEVRYDSILVKLPAIKVDSMDNYQKDSLLVVINDTLGTTVEDTTIVHEYQARMSGVDSIESWQKTPVYHNNRTPLYIETFRHQLVTKGVLEEQFQLNALGLIPENKRTQVVFVNGIAFVVRVE